jgi:CRISPR-associated protein Cmr6
MWLASNREPWSQCAPEQVHAGLGYTRGAPLEVLLNDTSESGLRARNGWLSSLVRCQEPPRYAQAYARWRESLRSPDVRCFTVKALSRVLVGHGTSAATGVGLTLQHTWGVPVLPGSALKGLTAHYMEAVYGADEREKAPERKPFRGLTWKDHRPVGAPGSLFRRLFGMPDLEASQEKAQRGEVLFHDALWVPASQGGSQAMLVRDVLTVHQRRYYESGGQEWPVDFDDPNPVSFLTVAPGGRFLVALEARGAPHLLERAERYVMEALAEWGLGGKTVAGYGRFAAEASRVRSTPLLTELKTWLEERKGQVAQREQFQELERAWVARLLGLEPEERRAAAHLLKQYLKLKRGEEQRRMEELLTRLGT